jgi:hypothetical protein
VAFLTLVASAFFLHRSFNAQNNSLAVIDQQIPSTVENRNPLTGAKLAAPLVELPQVFAVMVENSYEAWPLSGLDQAFLVIEAPVEGNIPRFISFFEQGTDVKKIGPVRSARPYYLDWADELGAIYAHVGGSPEALDLIKANGTTKDLNQFFQSEYFWRDEVNRFAPHNVYTSGALLDDAVKEVGKTVKIIDPWQFKDGVPSGERLSPKINWASGSVYDVIWEYATDKNLYIRMSGWSDVKTSSGSTIEANNVAVIASDITVVDATGRRHIRTVGQGDAIVYENGTKIVGTWKKPTRTDRLKFFDQAGKEIVMNAGKTWIEVVPDITAVTE